jgi:hypothetical protein
MVCGRQNTYHIYLTVESECAMGSDILRSKIERHVEVFRSFFKKTDKDLAMTVNVLLKEDQELCIAHCLELDLVTTGSSYGDAQKDIVDCIIAQVHYAFENDNLDFLFHPAPPEIWAEFFSCKEQVESRHRVPVKPKNTTSLKSFVPPWIITRMCRLSGACHA